jgi:hypothetical protein
MRTKVPAEEKRVMFRAELASHQQKGRKTIQTQLGNNNTESTSNTTSREFIIKIRYDYFP